MIIKHSDLNAYTNNYITGQETLEGEKPIKGEFFYSGANMLPM